MLKWIENWYLSMCNGDWEHIYGIKVDTLDNPGWIVSIDIIDTYLENIKFKTISKYINEDDFLFCEKKDGKFLGSGDINKLEKIFEIFKDWAEHSQ
ncbi:MAG: immunity 53 family protein [Firmicutes bacterium]|nr:immunity 53 family protein [Bacillota bacterium]